MTLGRRQQRALSTFRDDPCGPSRRAASGPRGQHRDFALIDPLDGQSLSALNQTGHFDHAVPAALSTPTLYSRWGEVPFLTAVTQCSLAVLFCRQRR